LIFLTDLTETRKLREKVDILPKPEKKTVRKTPDEQLAEHLGHAERHLIDAANLFDLANKPRRREGYFDKLVRAQETVTSLYAEELIRIRGPQRPPKRRKLRVVK
jgi:hypothetical protein